MPEVLIDEAIFIDGPDGRPRLRGSRCGACGVVTFPTQSGCPSCFTDSLDDVALPDRGTLWTFTTQGFPPKAPPEGSYIGPLDPFEPYTVGYVELEGHCKVEARLTEPDPSKLEIGMEMRLVLIPLNDELTTFAFEPVSP
ncbi:MAG: OB-fold domain-containing protein [Actinomycetota bacterium]